MGAEPASSYQRTLRSGHTQRLGPRHERSARALATCHEGEEQTAHAVLGVPLRVLVPQQPCPPAQARHQGCHPGTGDQAAVRKRKGRKGGRPVDHDAESYKERNTVERLINKLKAWRGIATRYDETPGGYLAGLQRRASMIWINDLTQTIN